MSERIPRMARGRRNRFFDADGVDDLVAMVIELTSELSVLKERQYMTERVLEENGLSVSEGIENWQPSEAEENYMAEQRKNLLGNVLRTLDVDSKGLGENNPNLVKQPTDIKNAESRNC